MLTGHDAIKHANLKRLEVSTLPTQWAEQYPTGWELSDQADLASELAKAGYSPIDTAKAAELIQWARSKKPPVNPKTSVRSGLSLDKVQTVNRLATAEWANPLDFAGRRGYERGDFWIGRCPMSGAPLGHRDEGHVLLCCMPRGGKGTTTILPNHLLWLGSLVSVDPKGENASVTAARRGDGDGVCVGMGQSVNVLDPMRCATVNAKYRKRFNPLDALDIDDPQFIEKSASLAESMIIRTGRETDDYWKDDAQDALQAIILHIKTAPEFEGKRNLNTLRHLVLRGDLTAWKALKEAGEEDIPNPMSLLFGMMSRNESCGDIISGMGSALLEMKIKGEKQWIGVRAALRTNTSFLGSTNIQECVSVSDFSLSELKDDPKGMSLFLCLPADNMATHNRWLRVMITLIMYDVRRSRQKPAKYPILMCLDEFSTLGYLKKLEDGMDTLASYGVKLLIVLQYWSQLKKNYNDGAAGFESCTSLKIFFAINDETTADQASKMVGETDLTLYPEHHSKASNFQKNMSISRSQSESQGHTDSHTENQSDGTSEAVGTGTSDALGTGASTGIGGGDNRSLATNSGRSQGWNPPALFFRNTVEFLPFLRSGETAGIQSGTSESHGSNNHWSRNTSTNRTHTDSKNRTQTLSTQKGFADTVSRTHQQSTSLGTQEGTTEGGSLNVAVHESFHKRPLISTSDVKFQFARQDENDPCYPGLGLVLIANERPVVVQRTNYYEDIAFDGMWDQNPGYPGSVPPPLERSERFIVEGGENDRLWECGIPVIARWLKHTGDAITKGEPILEVKPGPSFTKFVDSLIPVYASRTGTLENILVPANQPFEFNVDLAIIGYHMEDEIRERDIVVVSEVAAYNRGDHPAYSSYKGKKDALERRERAEREQARIEAEERKRIEREEAAIKAMERKRAEHDAFNDAYNNLANQIGWGIAVVGFVAIGVKMWLGYGVEWSLKRLAGARWIDCPILILIAFGSALLMQYVRREFFSQRWENIENKDNQEYWIEKAARRRSFFAKKIYWKRWEWIGSVLFNSWTFTAALIVTWISETMRWYHLVCGWISIVIVMVIVYYGSNKIYSFLRRIKWMCNEGEIVGPNGDVIDLEDLQPLS